MAHQNFSVAYAGVVGVSQSDGFPVTYTVSAKERHTETTVGVTRIKPTGFMSPTAYDYKKVDIVYQQGTCLNNTNPPNVGNWGQLYSGVVAGEGGVKRFNGAEHYNLTLGESLSSADENELRNQALIAVRNKLKSTDINLGIAYGERNRTARLIGDTASRLARAVRALRRGAIRRAMDELGISSRRGQPRGNNVPQRWLELQYGWRPLLSDVYGAASALEKRQKGDWRVTAKATRSFKVDVVKEFTGVGMSTCRASAEYSVFARLDALPQNEAIISLASLGVTNPISVGWELVPFSFVVDWFYPVGSFVSSLDAMLGYASASYSSSLLTKIEWIDKGKSGFSSGNEVTNIFTGTKKVLHLKRVVSSSLPVPHPPGLKDPRSLGHMANGLALLAQVFGRRR